MKNPGFEVQNGNNEQPEKLAKMQSRLVRLNQLPPSPSRDAEILETKEIIVSLGGKVNENVVSSSSESPVENPGDKDAIDAIERAEKVLLNGGAAFQVVKDMFTLVHSFRQSIKAGREIVSPDLIARLAEAEAALDTHLEKIDDERKQTPGGRGIAPAASAILGGTKGRRGIEETNPMSKEDAAERRMKQGASK